MTNNYFRIIYDKEGQLCNRFWSYLHSIIWAIENSKKVYSIFWDPQIKDFDNLRHNNYIHFPFYNWMWNLKLFSKYPVRDVLFRIYNSPKFSLFVQSSRSKEYGFYKGWGSCSPEQCKRTWGNKPIMEAIRQIYKPNKNIIDKVNYLFNASYDRQSQVVVGIHIRKGDYKDWCNGRYYYSDDIYISIMRHIQKMFNKDVHFFCATNEHLSENIVKEFSPLVITQSTAAEDLYALSICDYIVGPPSSFSQWASFYGEVPLYLIEDPCILPNKDDFSCIYSLDHFENGHIIHIP